jgi:hypothetical protein
MIADTAQWPYLPVLGRVLLLNIMKSTVGEFIDRSLWFMQISAVYQA